MAQLKPSMKSFGQALAGQKLKSTYINQSAFTSSTAVMSAPGMTSPGAFSAVELGELSSIKKNLVSLVAIEKKYNDFLGDKIIKFARSEERTRLKKRESSQETKEKTEKKAKDNPIVKGAMKGLDGLIGFFGDLFKWFIGYKIVEWVSKPENLKKVQDFAKLFVGIFKFISNVVGFGVDKIMSGLSHLVDGGGITRVFGALEMIVGFFTLKWLLNPTKIISDIKMIGTLFTKIIPNAINGVLNFFTNLIPSVATDAVDTAVNEGLKGAATAGKEAVKSASQQVTEQAAKSGGKAAAEGAAKGAAKGAGAVAAKGAAKGAGKSLLKKLPVIGAITGGVFAVDRASKGDWVGAGMEAASGAASLLPGWGTAASLGIDAALVARDLAKEKEKEDKNIPKLAKGGIVTKPTKAIVGEAGPEAILPLEKLSSFTGKGIESDVGKIIPKFMKMLTIPFTLVGAGIIALMSSSLSVIPGIGPLMMPLISSIASTFGIPPSIVKGVSKFVKNPLEAVKGGATNISKLFGDASPRVSKQKGGKFTPSNDTSVRGLLANILGALVSKNSDQPAPTATPAPSGGSPSAAPGTGGISAPGPGAGTATAADNAKQTIQKAGGLREDGTLKGVQGTVIDKGRAGKEYSPGGGLKPVINGNRKYWYDATGNVFKWEKPGDPLTDITSTRLFDSKTLGGPLVRIPSTGEVKILTAALGGDQTAVGMYNYAMGKILKSRGVKGPKGGKGKDVWETPTEGIYGRPAKFNKGGGVKGSGIGDKQPALLESEEYVLNRNLARAMGGPKVLDHLNFNVHPRFGTSKLAQIQRNEDKASGDGRPKTRMLQIGGAAILEGAKKIAGMGKGAANMCAATTRAALRAAGHPDAGKVTQKGDLDAEGTKYNGVNFAASFAGSDMGAVIRNTSGLQAGDIVLWKGGNGYPSGTITHVGIKGEGNDLWHHGRSAGFRKASMYTSSGGQTFAAGIRLGGTGTVGGGPGSTAETQESEVSWADITKSLGSLYKGLTGTPSQTIPSAPVLPPAPAPKPSIPTSSVRLQQAQQTSNQNRATQQTTAQSKPGGNIVSLSQGTNVINQSQVETLAPALGNTIPPTPLTVFPATP